MLDRLLTGGDSGPSAMSRAESYFLVNAMVSDSLTFALGPRLLLPSDEDAPDGIYEEEEVEDDEADNRENRHQDEESHGFVDEQTTLLPQRMVRHINRAGQYGYAKGTKHWDRLPYWAQRTLEVTYSFANAPLLGAVVGAIIGLTPSLHKLFFNHSNHGGYFNAWLTTSIKNVGDLFASLQIIVVGVKLSQGLRKMKKGEESGDVPWLSMAFVTFVRFLFWPLLVPVKAIFDVSQEANVK